MSKGNPHSAEFKAKVALEALREQKTLSELKFAVWRSQQSNQRVEEAPNRAIVSGI
jgi:hypothetical protein